MPQIGQFTAENETFVGRVHTLTLYRELTIVPAEPSDADNAPAYRVLHGAEDALAEETAFFRLECAVIDRLRVFYLTFGPGADGIRRGHANGHMIHLIHFFQADQFTDRFSGVHHNIERRTI